MAKQRSGSQESSMAPESRTVSAVGLDFIMFFLENPWVNHIGQQRENALPAILAHYGLTMELTAGH